MDHKILDKEVVGASECVESYLAILIVVNGNTGAIFSRGSGDGKRTWCYSARNLSPSSCFATPAGQPHCPTA